MIKTEILKLDPPGPTMLTLFKQYASVADTSRDLMLSSLLKSALDKVQQVADESILRATIAINVSERESDGPIRLYQTPGEILTVVDGNNEPIDYRLEGKSLILGHFSPFVRVVYTTIPKDDYTALFQIALRYATALYDGESAEVLNSILQEIC